MKKSFAFLISFLFASFLVNAQNWLTTGNTGLNSSNFLGNKDAVPLTLKVRNWRSGFIDFDSAKANTSLGYRALLAGAGNQNASLGYKSLAMNTTGSWNTAFGFQALNKNTTGYSNAANGKEALFSNTTGFANVGIGNVAIFSNTTGKNNTANGYKSMYFNTTGSSNVAIGTSALYRNTILSNTVAIGDSALYNNGVGAVAGSADGTGNVALGSKVLYLNTTGTRNTASGYRALSSNSVGSFNTAHGYNSLSGNTTGEANTAVGNYALPSNTTGYNNTATGSAALFSTTTGNYNTAGGGASLVNNTTGSYNTANGNSALSNNTTGSYNTALGNNTYVSENNLSNATALGYYAYVDASNKVRVGNLAVTSIGGQVGWTNFSDGRIKNNIRENVPGLAFVNLLKPVTYHFDMEKQNALMGRVDTSRYEGKNDIEKIAFTGFVAQAVEDAAKKIGYDFSGVDKTGKIMGLRYAEFVVPLVKAVQELDARDAIQQKEIENLKNELAAIKEMLASSVTSTQSIEVSDTGKPALGQNIPNPFGTSTTIPFSIPADCNQAMLVITESATARQMKSIPVSCREKFITLEAGALPSGLYQYTLYVNGEAVDSKSMIIRK